ncbi:MAG: glycosyltransferase family 4 protein [Nitrospira sp.]
MNTSNAKKRILIFSTAYYPFVAGAEVSIKEITDRLSSDFDFDLITARLQSNLPDKERIGQVNVYRVGVGIPTFDKLILPFLGAILVWRLQRRNNYFCMWGVMATFASGAGYVSNLFRRFLGKKKIPMVLSLQEGDSESHLKYRWGGLIGLSWKLALANTDILTALSNFLLDRAKKNGFKGQMFLVPNGVDLDLFTKEIDISTREDFKNKLGKKSGDVYLVTSSRLMYKNAVDDIISALVNLPKNVSLIVLGKGDLGPSLQRQADSLGVADRVKFLGFIPHADLPKYLSVCDIFIRPSRSEGFGNSFIEAMALKIPVIATPVGGIPDFLDDKETGVFCSPDNPQSIVLAVNTILNNDDIRDRIIKKAFDRVVERYGWEDISMKMREVFHKLEK